MDDIDLIALAAANDIALMCGQDQSQLVSRIQVRVIQALLANNGPPAFSARYFKRKWESVEDELAALQARIADGELADIADDGKHNGESALLSAAIRAGYYRGLPVLVLPATVLETPTARDGGSE
jgi:transposase InsO family protein